jgi:anti-sigma factor RsiW
MTVPADDLTCRELVDLVTEYLEHALPPADAARFDAHLAHCPACRHHLAEIRLAIALVGRLTERSLSPRAEADLVAAFRGWRAGSTRQLSPGATDAAQV